MDRASVACYVPSPVVRFVLLTEEASDLGRGGTESRILQRCVPTTSSAVISLSVLEMEAHLAVQRPSHLAL